MSSHWSTTSQPPGASTTCPTPLQADDIDDDDDLIAYDFATIGGSPLSQYNPDTSGESFQYIPSTANSHEKESETVARDTSGGLGRSVAGGEQGEKGMKGLRLMLPMSPSGDKGLVGQGATTDPSILYDTVPHPPRPPISIAESSSPSRPAAPPALPPSKPSQSLYSRWADPDYVPEPPANPMKLLKTPPASAPKPSPSLDVSAPSFAPPAHNAPARAPIPILPPHIAAQLSMADQFRAKFASASSTPREAAPTPPPPPSPATTRSSSTAPGISEGEKNGGVGEGSTSGGKLRKAREALTLAERRVVKLESERQDLLAQLKEAAEVAMKEGDQADAQRRGLEELVISLRERCAEMEASETALEEERDDLKGRLEEAVREIVEREDSPASPETLLKLQEHLKRRLADTMNQLRTAELETKRTMDICTHLQDELNAEKVHQQVVSTRLMEAKEESRKQVAQAKEERDLAIARVKELEGEELVLAEFRKRLDEEQEHRMRERMEWSGQVKELAREKDELAAQLDVAIACQRSNSASNEPRRYSVQELIDLARSPLSNVAPNLSNAPPEMVTLYAQSSNDNSNGARSSTSASSTSRSQPFPRRLSIPSSPTKPDRDTRTINSLRREIDGLKLGFCKLQTEKDAAEYDARKEVERRGAIARKSEELEQTVAKQGGWLEELLETVQELEAENGNLKARLDGGGPAPPAAATPAPLAPAPRSPPSDDPHSSRFVNPSGSPTFSAPLSPNLWPSSSSTHPEAPPPPLSSVLARDLTPPLSMHDPLRPGSVPVVQVGELVDVGNGGGAERGGGGRGGGELQELERAFGEKTDQGGVEKELERVENEFAAESGYGGGGVGGGAHGREWSSLTAGSAVDSKKGFSEPGDIDDIMRREEGGSSTLLDSFHSAASGYDNTPSLSPLPITAPLWDTPHLPYSSSAMSSPSMTSPTSPRLGSASSTGSRASGHHSRGGSASGGWLKGSSVGGGRSEAYTEEDEEL